MVKEHKYLNINVAKAKGAHLYRFVVLASVQISEWSSYAGCPEVLRGRKFHNGQHLVIRTISHVFIRIIDPVLNIQNGPD